MAIAFVGAWTGIQFNSSSGGSTATRTVTTGNFLGIATSGDQATIGTTSTTPADTVALANAATRNASPGDYIRLQYVAAATGSATYTVNISTTAGSFSAICAAEWSGLTATPLDQASITGTGNSGTLLSTSVTTTQADELLLGHGTIVAATDAVWTAGASQTIRSQTNTDSTGSCTFLEERIVSSTAGYQMGATKGAGSGIWICGIATFKAASTAAAAVPVQRRQRRSLLSFVVRRGRVTNTPQPGLPPPPTYRVPVARTRLRFLARHGETVITPPAPPVAPPPPSIPVNASRDPWRGLRVARARSTVAPQPGLPAPPAPFIFRHRAPRPRFLPLRRGDTVTVPPVAPVAPTVVYIPPNIPRRRPFGWVRRGEIVVVPPAPVVVVPPPSIPVNASRDPWRGIFTRRGRTLATPPAVIVVIPPAYIAPNPTRRPWRGLRVARARATLTPQPGLPAPPVYVVPTVRPTRSWRGLRWLRGRLLATPPQPPSGPTGPYAMATLSQDAGELNLEWVEGDPISVAIVVQNVDWSGTYTAQIRAVPGLTQPLVGALTAVATYSAPNTTFLLTMSAVNSALILAGSYVWDLQQTAGPTRLRGRVTVKGQVTQ